MLKKIFFVSIFSLLFFSCKDKYSNLKDGLYAEIKTKKGEILVQLEYEKTPVTVANFVSLAEGTNPKVNPEYKNKPFYNGLKFHRVLANFMIQGGDPLGNGSGDAGYKFKDEFTDLKFDNGGLLAMANGGPFTNGTQFFITHVETPWLDGKHTIFGHVVENGMETVNKIVQDDVIVSIKIIRKGDKATKFDAPKVFSDYFAQSETEEKARKEAYIQKYKAVIDEKIKEFNDLKATGTKTATGLMYKILKKGTGKKPAEGEMMNIEYAGFLEDATLFDTSIKTVAEKFGKFDAQRAAENGYAPINFAAGRKDGIIPGFIEALGLMNIGEKAIVFIPSEIGYGAQGSGDAIPPNANLIFEIELK